MPKVSIVMPVYNVEKYLRECLDSICAQTLTDWECICVDDGSTDSSPAILGEYAAKDSRFRVFGQKNKGSGPARNFALDNACGRSVCFMDPDDKYPSGDVLEKMYGALQDSKCDIVGGNLRLIADDGGFLGDKNFGYRGVMSYSDTQQQYGYQCYLFMRSFIENYAIRFPILWRRQDPVFFVNCMLAAKKFYAIEKIVYSYRMRDVSRQVDWLADGGIRLKDNMSGIELVGDLAREHGLWRLYEHNFQCLSDCGAFSRVAEADVVMSRLRAFVRSVERSGKVPYSGIIGQAMRMFRGEKSRVKRCFAIARVFGIDVMAHMLAGACKQKMPRFMM